jgi:DNA polymerase II small subunit/DNA polymerase delta subunit B
MVLKLPSKISVTNLIQTSNKLHKKIANFRKYNASLSLELSALQQIHEESNKKHKERIAQLEEDVAGAVKAKGILEAAVEKMKQRIEQLDTPPAEPDSPPAYNSKPKKRITKTTLIADLDLANSEKELLERDKTTLKKYNVYFILY